MAPQPRGHGRVPPVLARLAGSCCLCTRPLPALLRAERGEQRLTSSAQKKKPPAKCAIQSIFPSWMLPFWKDTHLCALTCGRDAHIRVHTHTPVLPAGWVGPCGRHCTCCVTSHHQSPVGLRNPLPRRKRPRGCESASDQGCPASVSPTRRRDHGL